MLHSFGSVYDGQAPAAGLTNVNGTLYGTTSYGGTHGWGTVFSIKTSGKETVLHNFSNFGGGLNPYAGLTNVNGTLYGTTEYGGAKASGIWGTVFAITTSGKEHTVYSFKGGNTDGETPIGSLLDVKGTLYGTTEYGGSGSGSSCRNGSYSGCGTVFSITTSGKETVLHSFTGGSSDGAYPLANLLNVKGMLYGTTGGGGNSTCYPSSRVCGTVFKIATSGEETVLHRFNGKDGASPAAGLTNLTSSLYGTTEFGGKGHGTVFSSTPP